MEGQLRRSWPRLADQLAEGRFADLCRFLDKQRTSWKALPGDKDVLKAFRLTPFEKVKVVIVGQDPYPDPKYAMGLAFSVRAGVRPHPPSLRNIMHAVQTDFPSIASAHSGDLTRWAKEEHVLLLNQTLTVKARKPRSHRGKGWARFTRSAIELLNERDGPPIVFLLWGAEAQRVRSSITRPHHVLTAFHPTDRRDRFVQSHTFRDANRFLTRQGLPPVDWRY